MCNEVCACCERDICFCKTRPQPELESILRNLWDDRDSSHYYKTVRIYRYDSSKSEFCIRTDNPNPSKTMILKELNRLNYKQVMNYHDINYIVFKDHNAYITE